MFELFLLVFMSIVCVMAVVLAVHESVCQFVAGRYWYSMVLDITAVLFAVFAFAGMHAFARIAL